jgi:CRP-like cAMP-binding protein
MFSDIENQLAKQETASGVPSSRLTVPTLSERLQHRREDLEHQLKQTQEAIEALESSPEVQRAVDAIAKLGHF